MNGWNGIYGWMKGRNGMNEFMDKMEWMNELHGNAWQC